MNADTWYLWTGGVAATLAIGAATPHTLRSIGRGIRSVYRAIRAVVLFVQAVPELVALPAAFHRHAGDDLAFQRWIVRKLDITGPYPDEETTTDEH